jgi:hypothetical protein
MKRTKGAMKARLLELDTPLSAKVDTLTARREKVEPSAKENLQAYREYTRKQREQVHFEYLLSVLVWKENQDRSKGEAGVTRKDVLEFWGEDEILSIEECTDWKDIEKEYEFAMRKEPNYELYLLRNHLDWLDLYAGKIEKDAEDGQISFRNSIPDYLKRYVYEARQCDLHGL